MKESALPYWLTFAVVLCGAYVGWTLLRDGRSAVPHGSATLPLSEAEQAADAKEAARRAAAEGPPLTEFTLTERSGEPFHSQELSGQVWVASVFYTACPSICRMLNDQLDRMQKDDRFRDVRFVSISCDPKRDTPDVLARYADLYKADPERWLFLTGDLEHIQRIGRDILKISVQGETHSDRGVVFDREGEVRGRFAVIDLPGQPNERGAMEKMMLECLAEESPARPPPSDAEGEAPEGEDPRKKDNVEPTPSASN